MSHLMALVSFSKEKLPSVSLASEMKRLYNYPLKTVFLFLWNNITKQSKLNGTSFWLGLLSLISFENFHLPSKVPFKIATKFFSGVYLVLLRSSC